MNPRASLQSVPGIAEVRSFGPAQAPRVLIELPHGATRKIHFDRVRERLSGDYPDDLEQFFFVNTDVGAPECADEIGRILGRAAIPSIVLRCLLPRTFVDCNRSLDEPREGRMTPGLPEYVQEVDAALLRSSHAAYQELAARAYAEVCGSGGIGLTLHTYAPRSVGIERIDAGIVQALKRAYAPERYRQWPRRPDVDVISEDARGRRLAPADLVERLRREYAAIDIELAENATYRLHPGSMGHVHSERYPDRVLCIEINRELLADPFRPFEEMRIAPEKVERMCGPIANALVNRR